MHSAYSTTACQLSMLVAAAAQDGAGMLSWRVTVRLTCMARGSQRDLATKTKGRKGNRAGGAGTGSTATGERIVLD